MIASTNPARSRWSPVTETDDQAPPDAVPFELTAAERSQLLARLSAVTPA